MGRAGVGHKSMGWGGPGLDTRARAGLDTRARAGVGHKGKGRGWTREQGPGWTQEQGPGLDMSKGQIQGGTGMKLVLVSFTLIYTHCQLHVHKYCVILH